MRAALFSFAAWAIPGMIPARAQSWVDTVFPDRAHDFGTVARGSKVQHTFRVVNTTDRDIHIVDARTKCGCTEVRIGAHDIPPGAQSVVEATLDTTRFQGYKASGLILVIDRPEFIEVDLNMTCFIRGDVTLNPGLVNFGEVGRTAKPKVSLILTYAGGMPNWGVAKLQTGSSHVSAQLEPLGRSPEGFAQYQLTATLNPTVPSGFFKDEITLLTNDPSSPSIPVSVAANVVAGVTVSPAIINLGPIKAGSVVKKTVLLRSAQPFKVTELKTRRGDIVAKTVQDSPRTIHTLTVTLTAPKQPGPYNATLEVVTDLKDEPPAKFSTFATIVP